jgi:DNA-binding CsgD family transcriptional regulator/tetratricopeptide (TPR) repeat protein
VAIAGRGPTVPVLIGREVPLQAIRAAYDDARRGHLRIVLCTGEPGIGKSRLLSVAADRLEAIGGRVLRGGASEAEAMPPYLPFLEALAPVIRTAPLEELAADAGPGALALTTIFPEIPTRLQTHPSASPLPPEQSRLRLFQALGAFLAALASRRPLVLVLDDLQWADTASLDMLAYVAGHQITARILILGAFRDTAIQTHPALERALVRLQQTNRPESIRLGPLDQEQTAVLACQLLGSSLTAESARALQTHSEGNPFFTEELLRGWHHAGALHLTPEGWALHPESAGAIPASILSAVRLRIGRLPTDSIDHLRVASVIGRTFSVDLLARVLGHSPDSVEARLLEAVSHHLIEEEDAGGFRFAHDIIRACLHREVSTARRRRLHAQIGSALESAPSTTGTQQLAELAFHFSQSDDAARGASYSQQAAEHALAASAFEQAAGHWQAALHLLPEADEARGAAMLGLGEAMLLASRETPAAEAFRNAAAWYASRNQTLARARALRGLGLALWRQDALEEAHTILEQAVALLDRLPDLAPEAVRTRVELATLLGNVLAEPVSAVRHADVALRQARALDDPRLEASASRTMGFLLVLENRIAAGLPLLVRALELATASDEMAEAAECGSALAQAYVWSGRFRDAISISRQREQHARRAQQPYRLHFVYSWLAFLASARGSWAEAEVDLEQAHASLAGAASARPSAFLHQIRGYLAYQRAEFPQAAGHFRAALDVFQYKDPFEHQLCFGMLGLTHLAQGDRPMAERSLAEQEVLLRRLRAGSLPSVSAASTLLLLAVGLEDQDRTAALLPGLQACSGQHHWFLVDRILAAGEVLLGEWDAAARHLDAAESTARAEGLTPELERVLRARAALISACGGRGAAHAAATLRSQAADLAYRLRIIHRPATEIERGPLLSVPRPATAASLGLSPREAEVLQLVAAGLSSRRIAEQLSLSQHTVAKHLTSIFAKLGVDNRAAAAAFAIRHGLA